MENNQFTRIGTFCEKCREVMCRCYEYEKAQKLAEEILNQPKQWYIQLRGEIREVTEEEFNEVRIIEFFNYSSLKIDYKDNKLILILD